MGLLPRNAMDVIQIRGLKAISNKEEGKGQRQGRDMFCFAEPTFPAKEIPTRCCT